MMSSIAAAFKFIREIKNLTQEDLAEVLGVTPGHVGMIEQERSYPSYEVMDRLVNEFKVDANLFFGRGSHDDEALNLSLVNSVLNMNPEVKQMIKLYAHLIDKISTDPRDIEEFPI